MFVVKVPGINGLGKTKGCEKAGNAILKTFREEIPLNESGKVLDVSKLDLEEIHLDNSNLELSNKLIYKNAFETFEEKPKTIFLGGDHSISYSLTRAFFDYCQNSGKEPCLIVFDAHADCDDPNKEPTHEEWLRKLIEDKFPSENILLVGARKIWKNELNFLKENNVKIMPIDKFAGDLQDLGDTITEFSKNKELYVSIDVDVIDPAFAPGTGYPEPGGLSTREFLYIVQRINKVKNLRAVDIVEINPENDKNNVKVNLGAKILNELL